MDISVHDLKFEMLNDTLGCSLCFVSKVRHQKSVLIIVEMNNAFDCRYFRPIQCPHIRLSYVVVSHRNGR